MSEQTTPAAGDDAVAPAVACIRDGLLTLDPAELQELDEIITPRAAELLVKAFGADMWTVLAPLVEDEITEEDGPAAAGSEEALRDLMKNASYWRDRNPETVRRVSEGFRALYDGKG